MVGRNENNLRVHRMTQGKVATTVRRLQLKKTEFRLVHRGDRYFGMVDGKVVIDGEAEDEVWRLLLGDHSSGTGRYVGIDGARKLFLHHYPNGFGSAAYELHGERGYKVLAESKLDQHVPLERALDEKGHAEPILAAFNATNLKSIYGKMRIRDALRSQDADSFIQAAARFTIGEGRRNALRDMEKALKKHGAAKWTSITYLPFLWRPAEHMFLKPEATVDFAERTRHHFASAYAPALDLKVYESLLDLAATTKNSLQDLDPRDNIDIQSFIWVVSGAHEGEAPRP